MTAEVILLSTRERIEATERLQFMRDQQAEARRNSPETLDRIEKLAALIRAYRLQKDLKFYAAYSRRHTPETPDAA